MQKKILDERINVLKLGNLLSLYLLANAPNGLEMSEIKEISHICADALSAIEKCETEDDIYLKTIVAVNDFRYILGYVSDSSCTHSTQFSKDYSDGISVMRFYLSKTTEEWEEIIANSSGARLQKGIR